MTKQYSRLLWGPDMTKFGTGYGHIGTWRRWIRNGINLPVVHIVGIGLPAFIAAVYGLKQALMGACSLEGLSFASGRTANLSARADGFDQVEGTPLVRIAKGKPRDAIEVNEKFAHGLIYDAGWEASVVVEFDGDIFKPEGIVALMLTAGSQVGLGALRPDSHRFVRRKSEPSFAFGTFAVTV